MEKDPQIFSDDNDGTRTTAGDPASGFQSERSLSRRRAITTVTSVIIGGAGLIRLYTALSKTASPPVPTYTPATPQPVQGTISIYHKHTSIVWAAIWSPDGKSIASSSNEGNVRLWNARTQELQFLYKQDMFIATSLAWSPNGKYIAADGFPGASVWDVVTGKELFVQNAYSMLPHAVAW